jgi:hypothetical protein
VNNEVITKRVEIPQIESKLPQIHPQIESKFILTKSSKHSKKIILFNEKTKVIASENELNNKIESNVANKFLLNLKIGKVERKSIRRRTILQKSPDISPVLNENTLEKFESMLKESEKKREIPFTIHETLSESPIITENEIKVEQSNTIIENDKKEKPKIKLSLSSAKRVLFRHRNN